MIRIFDPGCLSLIEALLAEAWQLQCHSREGVPRGASHGPSDMTSGSMAAHTNFRCCQLQGSPFIELSPAVSHC